MCAAIQLALPVLLLPLLLAAQQQQTKLSAEDAKKLKNPVAFTRKSIQRGHDLYLRSCVGCHGDNGKALIDVVANATDLTDPKAYQDGTSDGEIYRSIRDGAGASMPSFRTEIAKDEDLWHLVNFIHSLWPPDQQPPLQKDKE